jgi:hypothetical protein
MTLAARAFIPHPAALGESACPSPAGSHYGKRPLAARLEKAPPLRSLMIEDAPLGRCPHPGGFRKPPDLRVECSFRLPRRRIPYKNLLRLEVLSGASTRKDAGAINELI